MASSKFTKKQRQTLKELESVAKRHGLRISYGNLKFAGLKLRGGQCLLRGEKWVVMDRRQPFEDQVDVFREALSQYDLESEELSSEIKALLQFPARRVRKKPEPLTDSG